MMNSREKTFSNDIDEVCARLNKKLWLPFLSRGSVLRLFCDLSNRMRERYRNMRHEDSEKVLARMNELDRLYKEREEEREAQLRKCLDIQKKAVLDAASKAFCHGVCKERAGFDGSVLCSCQRRNRYVSNLQKAFDAYMKENAEKLVIQYKESPKWKNQSKE